MRVSKLSWNGVQWHAGYNDRTILCGPADLEFIENELEAYQIDLPVDVAQKAVNLDFEPTVEMNDNSVTTSFVYFTKWGGFIQSTFDNTRQFPHTVLNGNQEMLIEYDCGISF